MQQGPDEIRIVGAGRGLQRRDGAAEVGLGLDLALPIGEDPTIDQHRPRDEPRVRPVALGEPQRGAGEPLALLGDAVAPHQQPRQRHSRRGRSVVMAMGQRGVERVLEQRTRLGVATEADQCPRREDLRLGLHRRVVDRDGLAPDLVRERERVVESARAIEQASLGQRVPQACDHFTGLGVFGRRDALPQHRHVRATLDRLEPVDQLDRLRGDLRIALLQQRDGLADLVGARAEALGPQIVGLVGLLVPQQRGLAAVAVHRDPRLGVVVERRDHTHARGLGVRRVGPAQDLFERSALRRPPDVRELLGARRARGAPRDPDRDADEPHEPGSDHRHTQSSRRVDLC